MVRRAIVAILFCTAFGVLVASCGDDDLAIDGGGDAGEDSGSNTDTDTDTDSGRNCLPA